MTKHAMKKGGKVNLNLHAKSAKLSSGSKKIKSPGYEKNIKDMKKRKPVKDLRIK